MSEQELSQFAVQVEGLGQFMFRRRRMRLDIAINVERQRLTEGVLLDPVSFVFTNAIAEMKVLLVDAPADCDVRPGNLDDLDTFDDGVYERVLNVWGALTEKEATFRKGAGTRVPDGGEGAGGNLRPLVPQAIQPVADGPPLP